MAAVRLNAAAITAGTLPARSEIADPFEVITGICERPLVVSRRDVIKAAGVAAVVATGAFATGSLKPIASPRMGASARSAWLRAGWHRALLDPAAFGGSPSLRVSSDRDWHVVLSHAIFPGTALPAGLDLLVTGSGALAQVRIRHEFGGFDTVVSLADWLAGQASATARVRLSGLRVVLGSGVILHFAESAVATLKPDWSLTLEGPAVATVSGLGPSVVADSVTLALAATDAPTLLSRQVARRTLITLTAGTHEWRIDSPPANGAGGVTFDAKTFDSLTLEAAEARSGSVYHALVASTASGGRASFAPALRSGARVSPLTLSNVRFGRLLGDGGAFHVAADYAAEPEWVVAGGKALLVGSAEWTEPFEFGDSTGKMKVAARPAASQVVAPFEGGIATPLSFSDGTRVTLNLGDRVPVVAPVAANGFGMFDPIGQLIDYTPGLVPYPLPFDTYVDVFRPSDMLSLRFTFYNLSLVTGDAGTVLQRTNPDADSYISVRFPSQHVLEQAIKDNATAINAQLKPPLKSYLAETSRLVFLIPTARADAGIPYTLDGLLDWSGFRHRVVDAASLEEGTAPHDVGIANMRKPRAATVLGSVVPETSLAVPWGLWLSPYESEWWSHRSQTFTRNRRTELWHTRLHGRVVGGVIGPSSGAQDVSASAPIGPYEYPPTVRAVWAEHYGLRLQSDSVEATAPTANLFRNSFTRGTLADSPIPADYGGLKNRWSVVDLSGRFHADAIDVDNLMLTSLGAWLDVRGEWDLRHLKNDLGFPIMGDLIEWQHRATMGRDQYVKIVLLGRLFPFGHTAVEITVTERRVESTTKQAFLAQKSYIVVLEPVRTYAQSSEPINRRHPFKRVEIKTKKTPQIDAKKVVGTVDGDAYWVMTASPYGYFRFLIEATDWDGATHRFEMPLIWVRDTIATVGPTVPSISPSVTLGLCASEMPYQAAEFKGQKVAFAESSGGEDSNRVLPTNWIKFTAAVVSPSTFGEVRFEPLMWRANVRMDAIEEMTGQNAGVDIKIADIYRDNGYGPGNDVGKVFADIVTTGPVGFPAAMSGALSTPVPMLTGISAVKGAFGGAAAQVGGGQFSPTDFFDIANAKLIGGITLKDVLGAVLDLTQMPVFEKITDPLDANRIIVRYTWTTEVTEQYLIFEPLVTSGPTGSLTCPLALVAEMSKGLNADAGDVSSLVRGTLGPFKLNLVEGVFDAIHLTFGTFTFESLNGASPTVSPDITNVEFGGDLKYLAKLAEYLGTLTGSATSAALAERRALGGVNALETVVDAGPLKIDVTAQEIMASLTIAIPDLSIGVFSLTNMSFYAALHLPFTGAPVTLDFAFCSREAPFAIMVMGFGGGGYVMMTFDAEGMRALEVSLEFGAGVSFGIGGIASGMVEIKGGLTIRYEKVGASENLSFIVFIRIHGELDILGLISVTLTFYLELAYRSWSKALPDDPGHKADELTGTATLTIEIEILCFSFPVELSVTKTLAGEDPRFGELMPAQSDFDEFCAAFALAQLGA